MDFCPKCGVRTAGAADMMVHLFRAVELDATECVCNILRQRPHYINEIGVEGYRAIHFCAFRPEMLALLLSKGAQVDAKVADTRSSNYNDTLLDICEEIISYGDDEEPTSTRKATILLLIEHGATVRETHSFWTKTRHSARKRALNMRAQAAACLLSKSMRCEQVVPRDLREMLARAVLEMPLEAWCEWKQ